MLIILKLFLVLTIFFSINSMNFNCLETEKKENLDSVDTKVIQKTMIRDILEEYLLKDLVSIISLYVDQWECTSRFKDNEKIQALLELDNNKLAVGGYKVIKIWDMITYKLIDSINGHENNIISLCKLFKNRIASGSMDKTIKIWSLSSKKCLKTLKGHTDWVTILCLLPDGNLASASLDYTIKIWNLDNSNCLFTLTEAKNYINSMSLSPNNKYLISSGGDGVKIYDLKNRYKVVRENNWIKGFFCILPNRKFVVAFPDSNSKKHCYAIHDFFGEYLKVLEKKENNSNSISNPVRHLSVIDKNKLIACWDSSIEIWDLSTEECIGYNNFDVKKLVTLSNGTFVLSLNNEICVWANLAIYKVKDNKIQQEDFSEELEVEEPEDDWELI